MGTHDGSEEIRWTVRPLPLVASRWFHPLECSRSIFPTKKPRRHDDGEKVAMSCYEWATIIFSFLTLVVVAAYTFVTYKLLRQTQQQVSISQKQLSASNRPIVLAVEDIPSGPHIITRAVRFFNIATAPALFGKWRYVTDPAGEWRTCGVIEGRTDAILGPTIADVVDGRGLCFRYRSLDGLYYETFVFWDVETRRLLYNLRDDAVESSAW